MRRITNIDTLSALIDRLITENIKLFFFNKDKLIDEVNHQKRVIEEIKNRICELMKECLKNNKYEYLGEKRTFDENSIIEELEELIINDINIGEADRSRLKEAKSDTPNLERIVKNEKRLRKANEGRARNKNNIDTQFKSIIQRKKGGEK